MYQLDLFECQHKWNDNGKKREGFCMWYEICDKCGALRYGWRWGKSVEYTMPPNNACPVHAAGGVSENQNQLAACQ